MPQKILLAFVVCFPVLLRAQVDPERLADRYTEWRPGTIVLFSGDTVDCELSYNQTVSEGLLQVKDGDHVLTLSVHDLLGFYYYDRARERYRNFLSLEISPAGDPFKRKYFLEYHYGDEKIAIVSHKTVFTLRKFFLARLYTSYRGSLLLQQPVPVAYRYLLDVPKGEIHPFDEQSAFRLMQDKKEAVKSYMKHHRIELQREEDYIRVFRYHASL